MLLNVFNILQMVTPQRMELLRVKLREEVEGPYKEVQNYVHVQCVTAKGNFLGQCDLFNTKYPQVIKIEV